MASSPSSPNKMDSARSQIIAMATTGPRATTAPRVDRDLITTYPSLYGTASFSSIFAEPIDYEPGPGQYEVPHSLGIQCQSGKSNGERVTILSKHASSWSKVYISKEHAVKARDTPGPGTYLPQILNPDGHVRFGTDKRKNISYETPSPGPIYDVRMNLSEAGPRFGKDSRFGIGGLSGNLEGAIGPGQYNLLASFDGTKGLSKSFSVGHRAYDKVRFPGSEKVNLGRCSPGPGQFRNWTPSSKRTGFPRAKRKGLHDSSNDSMVGPGSYTLNSAMRNTSHGFGRAPAKARFSWKSNKIQMDTWCRLGMAQKLRG